MAVTETTQLSNGQPKFFKKHTEHEAAILKEYIRITNRVDLDWIQRIAFAMFDTRTQFAFSINVAVFMYSLYLSGSATLMNVDLADLVCSYLAADLLSGIFHIYLDHSKVRFDGSYVDFSRMGFQVHHLYPTFPWMMDKHFKPYMECNTIFPYANLVALANALTINLPVIPVAVIFVVSFQATHYYAHGRTHGKEVPWLVAKLQDMGVIISPRGHQQHHTMFNSDFCIFNGYMNRVCDWIMSDEKRVTLFVGKVDAIPPLFPLLVFGWMAGLLVNVEVLRLGFRMLGLLT